MARPSEALRGVFVGCCTFGDEIITSTGRTYIYIYTYIDTYIHIHTCRYINIYTHIYGLPIHDFVFGVGRGGTSPHLAAWAACSFLGSPLRDHVLFSIIGEFLCHALFFSSSSHPESVATVGVTGRRHTGEALRQLPVGGLGGRAQGHWMLGLYKLYPKPTSPQIHQALKSEVPDPHKLLPRT